MDSIILVLEIIGTCAFAISGAIKSINKHLDIFGVLLCALITALGGGVFRDILLGRLPPAMFQNYIYVIFALASAVLTFLTAAFLRKFYQEKLYMIDSVNNVFDAIGLGVFTVTGINAAVSSGFGDNAFFVIFLGMCTGCGGGVFRDILVGEIPMVLSKRVYAVASMCGGIVYYLMYITFDLNEMLSVICGIVSIFTIRILASVFRWDLPRAF